MKFKTFFTILAVFSISATLSGAWAVTPDARAEYILETSGVKGGLAVVLGCEDPELLMSLLANDSYLVQGLDTDAKRVAEARKAVLAKGLYGKATVAQWDGKTLPYVGDIVNLLVVANEDPKVSREEIVRVLAPMGVAVAGRYSKFKIRNSKLAGDYLVYRKPVPSDTDEWSHFLHDSGGNAVANDKQVGPPKSLRWVAGPKWSRSHEYPTSVNAVVSAGGRIFTIFDDAPAGVFRKLPQRCNLIARDAANGVLLWKVPMRKWQPEYGTGEGGRWSIHHTIPRRLIAEGDRVYVTLGFLDSPVSVLDAATGEILTEALEGTKGADEMILSGDVLFVKITKERSIGATVRFQKDELDDTLAAVDVRTGKQLWRKEGVRVAPYALSAKAGRVLFHNMEELICLDARSGEEKWRAPSRIPWTFGGSSTLVVADGVVLFHGHGEAEANNQKKAQPAAAKGKKPKKPSTSVFLTAFSMDDGKVLWRHKGGKGQAQASTLPTDVFVARGIVWCGGSKDGRDLRTGEVAKTLTLDKLISPGHHYRCFRSKATENFLIWPKRGAEFVDLEGDDHMRNDWLRSPCFAGATPANGLFYTPPSQCFCYPGVLVSGFLAMSADQPDNLNPAGKANLEKGPEYSQYVFPAPMNLRPSEDWYMYRRDTARSGYTPTPVPSDLSKKWRAELACQGSQPIVVDDRLWVAEKDAHRIRCLSTNDGRDVWSFTAGGRIDSAPVYHEGLLLFGCRDGSVYCLRADDGEMVWRFRAAPTDRRLVSFGQMESVWPVHGSVLVQDGVAYFAAGRSSFLDGGILVYGLDAKTGKVLYSHLLDGPHPDIKTDVGKPFAMEGALPDLLVSDGKDLYMGRIKFDRELNRIEAPWESTLGELDMGANHLVATGGFLDDTGFDRLYWMHGKRWPGFYFSQQSPKAGQLVVFDTAATYAVKYFYRRHQWSPLFIPEEDGYLLFADDIDNQPILEEKGQPKKAVEWLPEETKTDSHRRGGRGTEKGTGYVRERPAKWREMIPVRIRAMVLAGKTLFFAGPRDEIPEDDPFGSIEGRKGAALWAVDATNGKKLAAHSMRSVPVFDGMIAASGRLYMTTADGGIECWGGK